MSESSPPEHPQLRRTSLVGTFAAYVDIARPSHWMKNVFMLPGMLLAWAFEPSVATDELLWRIPLSIVCACLVASSNYVLNEILDADKDRHHPEKRFRPIPSGVVRVPLAWLEWIVLGAVGLGLSAVLGRRFFLSSALLLVMGLIYNVPPVRLKDVVYVDVLCESINNPIRMAMGWFATGFGAMPPLSAALAYWMFGAFLMAMKRFSEYRDIADPDRAARYRRSLGHYNDERLIESLVFYGAMFGMLSGFFIARYHVDLILATPLVAYAMAYYMHLGFKPGSPVQEPEGLWRQPKLVAIVLLAFAACAVLLVIEFPWFHSAIEPWVLPR